MASLLRPTMRLCFAAPSKRLLSTSSPAAASVFAPLARKPVQSAFVRDALPAMRVAPFHASARRPILPPLPQKIEGTVNQPAPVPDPVPAHGSYHWSFERVVAASLIPLTVAPFAAGSLNPVLDATLCSLLLIHSHIGFEAMIIDYFPAKRVPIVRRSLMWILKGFTLAVAVALYQFETNDVGLTEAIKRVWTA
ncbi:uncharacterized protein K452DRAFT_253518 [Aplosporella prunicola CBS 121167]|uniref:Succinate dehydrogenase [ubiquinone] cytochrome b small subunit n=1 Tax=Aplosporella prunicola CBS 121167 TaxID=1176127 RepID=A0A6A6B976_9PEZI|nr:uncharacterized protein K452DRAFT_253518 [Aplosporella prunicola CBS 121167]KAF2139903.1 hypothetical protein K452DRAFT_253518 [Aplosporella prunicola CBS 121167]